MGWVRRHQPHSIVNSHHHSKHLLAPALLALSFASVCIAASNTFRETDLVSDIEGRARFTDPHLVNPWGISSGPATPFWVSDADSGVSTLYGTNGNPLPLVVAIPPAGSGAPTGQVFNGGSAFNGDRFIFATEGGAIAGWRGALGTTAEILADNSSAGASYKGIALATVGSDSYLYAADFGNARIEVLPSSGAPALSGAFVDPLLPIGYAPFNIQNLAGQLYVTYAKQGPSGDDEAGPGNGFVSIFDLNGNLVKRLASGGALNSPWGLALAPGGFGDFGGNLLVGNFGDGTINAYDVESGSFIDSLRGGDGNPLMIEGLWGLKFGNGGAGGDLDKLYFAAGISGGEEIEAHGLFGSIAAIPEPSTLFAGAAMLGFCGAMFWKRRRRTCPAA